MSFSWAKWCRGRLIRLRGPWAQTESRGLGPLNTPQNVHGILDGPRILGWQPLRVIGFGKAKPLGLL